MALGDSCSLVPEQWPIMTVLASSDSSFLSGIHHAACLTKTDFSATIFKFFENLRFPEAKFPRRVILPIQNSGTESHQIISKTMDLASARLHSQDYIDHISGLNKGLYQKSCCPKRNNPATLLSGSWNSSSLSHLHPLEWAIDFLSHKNINQKFRAVCTPRSFKISLKGRENQMWTTWPLRFNNNMNKFTVRTSNLWPLAFAADALVDPWTQFKLVYAFPLMKILPRLLCKIEKKAWVILITPKLA